MNVADRVVQTLNARRVRDSEYRARCPVHQGKSETSLSIKDVGDRVLIFCHAGCELTDILAALAMKSAAELFDSVKSKPDPEIQRKLQAKRDLQRWAAAYLTIVCSFLRDIDGTIRFASFALSLYEDGKLDRNPDMEEDHWDLLGKAYRLRTDYERQFEILSGNNLQAKLDLWRELVQ